MQKHILSLTFFTVLLLATCATEKPKEEVKPTYFANLEVRYLANGQSLRGQAYFLVGDSLQNAKPYTIPGGASFMGSGMQAKTLLENRLRYEANMKAAFPEPLRFGFRAQASEPVEESTIEMSPIKGFKINSANKTNGINVELDGSLDASERLIFLFSDPNNEARTIVHPGPLTTSTVFLPADAIALFTPGEYTVYLVKVREEEVQEGNFLVNKLVEYYTTEQPFILGE